METTLGETDEESEQSKESEKSKEGEESGCGAVFDAHVRHEFVDHDVAATMKTMAAEPYVHNVPTLTGGYGRAGVVDFYTHHFVGKMPADTRIERISRTVGSDQVVDELIMYFTHDCPIDYMLPGIPPTGRKVVLPHVVVMKFKGGQSRPRAYLLGSSLRARSDRSHRPQQAARHGSPAGRGTCEKIKAQATPSVSAPFLLLVPNCCVCSDFAVMR